MQLPRFFGFVDLGIVTVIAVAVVLPPREMYAADVIKGGDDVQFKLALAEARTIAHPEDGRAAESFARVLGDGDQKDWAIDAAVASSERAKGSPTRWRALFATASAYVDRLDVQQGLDYANRALAACDNGTGACPSWEQIRMELYQSSLAAGVSSGIDPRHNLRGFRKASESGIREIRLGPGHDKERGSAVPAPSAGSASGQ
jgi:hypothetical protein